MKLFHLIPFFLLNLLLAGCSQPHKSIINDGVIPLNLGSLERCQSYNGLPKNWLSNSHAGMIYIPEGQLTLGSKQAYPDEYNFGKKQRHIPAFWIDQTEVTVAQFQSFVDSTDYKTDAEQQNEAAVFSPNPDQPKQWWHLKKGYTWKTPNGPNKDLPHPSEPVRYITKKDAEHYAVWLGRDLPTELEWEYAAKAGTTEDSTLEQQPINQTNQPLANYWQGEFPFNNLKLDHFEGVAPVGCFPANAFHLYDMIGNVWEWTKSPYKGPHDQHMGDYQGLRIQQYPTSSYVIKGGSYLCAQNSCARYRNSSRHPQELDLATSHVGFRTVLRSNNITQIDIIQDLP